MTAILKNLELTPISRCKTSEAAPQTVECCQGALGVLCCAGKHCWHAAMPLTPAGVQLSDPSGAPSGQRARARTCSARAVVLAHRGTAARRPAWQSDQLVTRRGLTAHASRGSCAFSPKLDSFVNLPPYEDV